MGEQSHSQYKMARDPELDVFQRHFIHLSLNSKRLCVWCVRARGGGGGDEENHEFLLMDLAFKLFCKTYAPINKEEISHLQFDNR